jgi:hypothetical protein
MRLSQPFDPIEVGEFDNFGFDFSADMGTATMVSTSWICILAKLQTVADPNPQAHVISASVQTTIEIRSPDGILRPVNGAFSVARIGGMPPSAAGGVYVLEATALLSDGRILKLNSTVGCIAAGC